MHLEIGIMQGRLVPRYKNLYQAFPAGYWEAEFFVARELGLQNIEFILDYATVDLNPLLSKNGIQKIQDVMMASGVGVKAICADYFMARPFHSSTRAESEEVLKILLENSALLQVKDITIPCVDQSAMKSAEDENIVIESVQKILPLAEKLRININFETDLPPREFAEFMRRLPSECAKVNYDIGNSASLGYDPEEEFQAYGHLISDLHVKDRVRGGKSVKLGTGNADFPKVFSLLKKQQFRGNITMQASRAEPYLEDLQRMKEQLDFTRGYVEKYLNH